MSTQRAEGPWFEDLELGQVFDQAPAYTLDEGRAAVHQSIVGDRLALPLDAVLSRRVTGEVVAHPAFVWDVAIGQSTLATHHVRANLFYRGLSLARLPAIGDTLATTTTVAGLRQNRRRPGREPTGLAALHIVTVDHLGRTVLDFHRCAMIPLRADVDTGRDDDLDAVGLDPQADARADSRADVLAGVRGWDLAALPVRPSPVEGSTIEIVGGDVVTSAPELARLTLNVARVHHDRVAAGGERLVYGGHTIGIALAQLSRALPGLLTVVAWQSCDHLGPVHEGDTLRSTVEVVRLLPGPPRGQLAELRVRVLADVDRPVLDWRLTGLLRAPM